MMRKHKSSLEFRSASAQDGALILRLFENARLQADLETWKWKNLSSVYGAAVTELASDTAGQLVGHYSVIPMQIEHGDRRVRAGIAVDALILPEYRSPWVYAELAQRVYRRCAEKGLEWVYGFPTPTNWIVKSRLLGWQDVGMLPFLTLELTGNFRCSDHRVTPLRSTEDFSGTRVSQCNPFGLLSVCRSPEYLRWKYWEHPTRRYFGFWDEDCCGYILFRTARWNREKVLLIADLLTGVSDPIRGCERLLAAAIAEGRKQGARRALAWMLPQIPYRAVFECLGFRATQEKTRIAMRDLNGSGQTWAVDSWYLTWGDSESLTLCA